MTDRLSHSYLRLLGPILTGTVLLFTPLLGDFHIESALLVALIGCFWAGIRACKMDAAKNDFWDALQIAGDIFLVGLPLLLNALITGCFSIHGLGFWLIFPLPSVYFGYAIGRLLRLWQLPYWRAIAVAILLTVSVGLFLFELLNYPQVYFFNHVWGGWPGPIYDEVVQVSSSAVFFRAVTVLWAVLLWHLPEVNRDQYAKWIVGFAAIGILVGYTQLTGFGVISPRSHLQNVLGGHQSTDHFELYYDKRLYSDYEIDLLAKEHEFYYRQIANQLALPARDSTNKIESYLYGHPWQKKALVGAKFTSYVPVWLQQDQLHIAKQQIDRSLKHELVHVMAKQFGNVLFNASWSIGLIEGLAVAIDGGFSKTSTVDQIVVSEKPYPKAKQLQQSFSPLGFYGGRSGVNYITSGSFVQYLMRRYPIANLKEAYRSGDLAGAYPKGWEQLTREWHQHLDSVQVDSVDQQVASQIYSIPSLFEQACPHVVSDFAETWDTFHFYEAERDTTKMLQALDKALSAADSVAPIKAQWSYHHLVNGDYQQVQQAAARQDTTVELQLLYADAFALFGNTNRAALFMDRAQNLFQQQPDSILKPALDTRLDSVQWQIYRQLTYYHNWPDSTTFAKANDRTKVRSVRKAIDRERWILVNQYAAQLVKEQLHQRYFDEYQRLIHHLAFQGNIELASRLIGKLSAISLRERYRERLEQERKWLLFLSAQICKPGNQDNL